MTTYRLQPAAYRDMETIWSYTADRWGANQADHYIDGLDETFELLARQPGLGRQDNCLGPTIRLHRHARHVIVYRQAEEGILVIRVLHDSMDMDSQLTSE